MKNIVFISAGDDALYLKQWKNKIKNFDLFVIYYGDNSQIANEHRMASNYFYEYKGLTKLGLAKNAIKAMPSILKEYDFFLFLDDDIDISIEDVEILFNTANEYGLEICQPGCTGYVNIEKTRRRDNTILRYVNLVEAMMPCFSKEALNKLIDTFEYSGSLWGVEAVWTIMLGHPKDKIAIVDACGGIHTKKTMYNYDRFYSLGIKPYQDLLDVGVKYKKELNYYGYSDITEFMTFNDYFGIIEK